MSAIGGSDLAVGGGAAVSPRKLGVTVIAWIGSFVLAFGLGYAGMMLVGTVYAHSCAGDAGDYRFQVRRP